MPPFKLEGLLPEDHARSRSQGACHGAPQRLPRFTKHYGSAGVGRDARTGRMSPTRPNQRSAPSFVAPLFVFRWVRLPRSLSAVSISTGIGAELSEPSSLMRA